MSGLAERHCVICKRTQQSAPRLGGIGAYTLLLRWLGFAGNYAHPGCVRKAQTEQGKARRTA